MTAENQQTAIIGPPISSGQPILSSFFYSTFLLVSANLIVSILMMIHIGDFWNVQTKDLLEWGGNIQGAFGAGQYWRLLVSCFIHNGILHLLSNVGALLFIGYAMEKRINSLRFLSAYITCALVSSLVSMYFQNPYTIAAGASGAILGMYGVFVPLLFSPDILNRDARISLSVCTIILGSLFLFSGLEPQSLAEHSIGKVDVPGHFSGFFTGLIIGTCYLPVLSAKKNICFFRYMQWIIQPLLVVITFLCVFPHIENGKARYTDLKIQLLISEIQEKAYEGIQHLDELPAETQVQQLQIYNQQIDSCIVILEEYLASPTADSISRQTNLSKHLQYLQLETTYTEELIQYIQSNYSILYEYSLNEKSLQLDKLQKEINGQTE